MIKTRGLLLTVLICNLENITHNFFFISEVTRLLSQFYLIFLLRNGLRHSHRPQHGIPFDPIMRGIEKASHHHNPIRIL